MTERLERTLGNPFDPAAAFSFQRIVQVDEREEFPADFVAALRREGAHHCLIPRELGGALQSFEESGLILRLIARRDLTAAIAFGQTFLGSIPVWLAGSEPQKQALAASIRGGALGCLALTEESHGGDLLACDFHAARVGERFLLNGRKWLINNGSRGAVATVFARTGEGSGLSDFSLFLLDKSRIAPGGSLASLDKIRTHGIRGADISGFECKDLALPASALVGAAGRGYEITLKTLQISRTMCAALALGAADTALRVALDFALNRRIFGDTVAKIPSARAQLAGAYTDLLICECLSVTAARAIQTCPDRLPVWSSVVKYLVPSLVEELIREAAVVLGARYYLRDSFHAGIFQKVMRDNAVVGLFDGSTAVNLHIIAGQLGALAAARPSDAGAPGRLNAIFDWRLQLPWRGFPRDTDLKFTTEGRDEIANAFRSLDCGGLPDPIARLVKEAIAELVSMDRAVGALTDPADRRANSVRRFALAKRYCLLEAAAACVLAWTSNRAGSGELFERGEWLAAALQRLLARLRPNGAVPLPESQFEMMERQYHRNELFSLRPLPLGESAAASAP
jgi:alkylation response protein AidB-like acyl-CoA dehydrogenase